MALLESPGGVLYPGASIGHTDAIAPSQGGARYEAFVRKHIRQSKGRWRGKPLNFYPQQSAFHHELLRTEAGRRIYNEALYGVPRKNGKSTDAAALALYLLLADGEPAPEVYGAAGSRDQARLVFVEASRMVRASPALSEWCTVRRNEIIVPSIDGVYKVVSADAGLSMGSNPSAVVADELHVWKGDEGRELYYALTTGMDARQDPLIVSITTAGYNRDSIGYEVFERGLAGEDELLMYWMGAKDGDNLDNFETWRRANPAPWLTRVHFERQKRRNPAPVFARLHLNRWTQSENLWLPRAAWLRCKGNARITPGERVWVGVDIGLRHDSSAVVEVALRRDALTGKRKYVVRARIFEPAEEGGTLDLAPVENYILDIARRQQVVEVRYDPHFFQRSAEDLSDRIRMHEVPMSNARTVPMAQLTYDAIIEQELEHDGDEAFAKQVLSAAVRETERGWRWSKAKSQWHIDALTALGLAMSGTTEARGAEPGGRPPTAAEASDDKRADGKREQLASRLIARARQTVHSGSVVECTREQYETAIRAGLQSYAGELIDDGDHVRAQIALREVWRLDQIHGPV